MGEPFFFGRLRIMRPRSRLPKIASVMTTVVCATMGSTCGSILGREATGFALKRTEL